MGTVYQAGFDITNIADWISIVILFAVSYSSLIVNTLRKDNLTSKKEVEAKVKVTEDDVKELKADIKQMTHTYTEDIKEFSNYKNNISNRLAIIETKLEKK